MERDKEQDGLAHRFSKERDKKQDGLAHIFRKQTRKKTPLVALSKRSQMAPRISSPALSMMQDHQPAQESSFSRGFSVVPARRGTDIIESAGEPDFRVTFEQEGGAT